MTDVYKLVHFHDAITERPTLVAKFDWYQITPDDYVLATGTRRELELAGLLAQPGIVELRRKATGTVCFETATEIGLTSNCARRTVPSCSQSESPLSARIICFIVPGLHVLLGKPS